MFFRNLGKHLTILYKLCTYSLLALLPTLFRNKVTPVYVKLPWWMALIHLRCHWHLLINFPGRVVCRYQFTSYGIYGMIWNELRHEMGQLINVKKNLYFVQNCLHRQKFMKKIDQTISLTYVRDIFIDRKHAEINQKCLNNVNK